MRGRRRHGTQPGGCLSRIWLLAIAGGIWLAGCGGSSTTIDQQNLQTSIEVGIAQQKHMLSVVQCPKNIQASKGVTFTCTATLASGQQVPFTVTGLDDKGNVHFGGFAQAVVAPSGAVTPRAAKKK